MKKPTTAVPNQAVIVTPSDGQHEIGPARKASRLRAALHAAPRVASQNTRGPHHPAAPALGQPQANHDSIIRTE